MQSKFIQTDTKERVSTSVDFLKLFQTMQRM